MAKIITKDAIYLKDELTGLNNMLYLNQEYDKFLDKESYIVAIDFRNLKYINDKFGHASGDDALKIFSTFVRREFVGSVVVRRSGDEFFILTSESHDEIFKKIKLIADEINELNLSGDIPYTFSFNAGVVKIDANIKNTLNKADLTMYDAKQKEMLIEDYHPSILEKHDLEMSLIKEVDDKIILRRFSYLYQEIIEEDHNLLDIIVVDEYNRPIFNDKNINILAKNYRIEKVDLVSTSEILKSIPNDNNIYMININHRTLFSKEFDYIARFKDLLMTNNVNPSNICINIDTTGCTGSTMSVVERINALKALGVKLSIGSINLDTQQFLTPILALAQIDYVKIDYSMLIGVEENERVRKVVHSISDLFTALNVTPIFVDVTNEMDAKKINRLALIRKK